MDARVFGMIVAGCIAMPWAATASEPPRIPSPGGPFAIGRIGYHWIDQQRPDRYSTDTQSHRELMVYLWYPASRNQADGKGSYLPGARQLDAMPDIRPRMQNELGANWPLIVSGEFSSHALELVPVAKDSTRWPVVVFSHGNGSTCFNYTSLIEDLVSRGYVVAAIEHTHSAMVVLFPDGRAVPFHKDVMPPELPPAERSRRKMESISTLIEEGAADVRFVLNRLTQLNAGDKRRFPLAGRLDLTRVAAMGHSAGAEFAARACQLDARFKACVDLDGGMVPVSALPEYPDGAILKQPLLFLEADHPESQLGGTPAQHQEYFKKKEEQLQRCQAGSYNVILKSPGIAHPSFSDIPLLFAGRDGYPETNLVLHNLNLIETFVRAFLDKNLRRAEAPLLDGLNTSHPEAAVYHYGH